MNQHERIRQQAAAYYHSGMFPAIKNEAQAYVLILAGEEMGLGSMDAVTGVVMVSGKPSLSANLLASLVKKHPRYDYQVVDHSDTICRIEFTQDGKPTGVSEFTLDDAKRAGLGGNATWKKYPAALLFARALTQGVRWYCPDATAGAAYTPDEIGAAEPEEPVSDVVPPDPLKILGEHIAEAELPEDQVDGLRQWIAPDHTADGDGHPAVDFERVEKAITAFQNGPDAVEDLLTAAMVKEGMV